MLVMTRVYYKVKSIIFKKILPLLNSEICIGSGFKLRKNVNINANGGKIVIGKGVFINSNSSINSRKMVSIGDYVLIGENVHIYDHNHCFELKDVPISSQGFTNSAVSIGDYCWIGSNVTILKGVNIGKNCVIGANCLIYKNIPDNTIVKLKQELILNDREVISCK